MYNIPEVDARHASEGFAEAIRLVFDAKNGGVVDRLLDRFSRSDMSYSDATLGRCTRTWDAYRATMHRLMPSWGDGRSYPLRIIGGPFSGVVHLSDTSELFGDEIRALAAVDIDSEGRVTRWVDYWDSTEFDPKLLERLRTSLDRWPEDLGKLPPRRSNLIDDRCHALHRFLSEAGQSTVLLSHDVIWEDMALRCQVIGAKAVSAMLSRIRDLAPFGYRAGVRHVLGNGMGGGYEWVSNSGALPMSGISALNLDAEGRISRITSLYDAARLTADARRRLVTTISGPNIENFTDPHVSQCQRI